MTPCGYDGARKFTILPKSERGKRFDGKVAVVTGAASGIGEAISRQLLNEGARVVAADINKDRLAKLEAEFSGNLVGVIADVTKEDDVAAMVAGRLRITRI